MARTNLFALIGSLLSIVSVGLLWIPMFLSGLSFSSADTDPAESIERYSMVASALFIIGAFLALVTQLGLTLEVPALVVVPFVIWHHGSPSLWALGGYAFALVGAILLAHSFFVQMTVPGWQVRIPPESRTRVWFTWKDDRNPRKIPKNIVRIAAALIIASVVASGAVLGNAYAHPESSIELQVVIDSDTYGAVNLSVVLDHDIVATAQVDADPVNRNTVYTLSIACTAGSHYFSVDAMSDTYPYTNNLLDYQTTLRVLPYTDEFVMVGIGVGFV